MSPRFFLDLVENDRTITDRVGMECDSEVDALNEASRGGRWIAAAYIGGRRPSLAWLRVRNEAGKLVAEMPVPAAGSFGVRPSEQDELIDSLN